MRLLSGGSNHVNKKWTKCRNIWKRVLSRHAFVLTCAVNLPMPEGPNAAVMCFFSSESCLICRRPQFAICTIDDFRAAAGPSFQLQLHLSFLYLDTSCLPAFAVLRFFFRLQSSSTRDLSAPSPLRLSHCCFNTRALLRFQPFTSSISFIFVPQYRIHGTTS